MRRLLIPTLTLAAFCIGFAPAPLPRRERAVKDSVAHRDLVGTWRTRTIFHPPSKVPQSPPGVSHVVITPTCWIFKQANGGEDVPYILHIDHLKRPAEINFLVTGQKEPYGRGLIRRDGDTLRVVYNWGTRPSHFDNQQSGCDLTLVRE